VGIRHFEQVAAVGILHFEQVAAVGTLDFGQVAAVGILDSGQVDDAVHNCCSGRAAEVGTQHAGSDTVDLEYIPDSASYYFDASLARLGLSVLTSLNGCHHRGFECLAVLVSAHSFCWLELH
jgi:hypothetical protein